MFCFLCLFFASNLHTHFLPPPIPPSLYNIMAGPMVQQLGVVLGKQLEASTASSLSHRGTV